MYVQTLPSLNFREAITISFKKYCTFSGRARRSEFWLLTLFASIIMSFLLIIFYIFFIIAFANIYKKHYNSYTDRYEYDNDSSVFTGYVIVLIIFMVIAEIVFLFPLISAGVRRLHDTGRSGCYYLLSFIPIADILLLLFLIEDSQQSINEYGPSPKYILMQEGSLINNSLATPQVVEGIPAPDYGYTQGYPQVNPYQQFPQYPQVNMQPNLYQEPNEQFPSSQDLLAKPVEST